MGIPQHEDVVRVLIGWAVAGTMHFIGCSYVRSCTEYLLCPPHWGGHIIFAFSAVRRPTWFPDILGNSSYPIFTKFGMQVYWVNSLYGIAFGDDSSIAN